MASLSGHIGLILSLAFEAECKATFASADLRERAPLNPTYIYSMPHLHTNRCYHYNQLCFWPPPCPTTASHRPSPHTASMTMQLQAAAGRCRAGCCHSSQWKSDWCLVLFHSNRMQMTLKPAWGRRRRFQNRAPIRNLSFLLITTRLLGVSPRCPTYL